MIAVSQKPKALFFNMPQDERFRKLEGFLTDKGVEVRRISPADHGQPIGYLLNLPSFEATAQKPFFDFSDEMLLMSGFDRALLNDLLAFFSHENLRRIELKAMLTPTNAAWNAVELHQRLRAEHRQMAAMKK